MDIQSKINYLRGFTESLDGSDSITKRQLTVLRVRLNQLLDDIEEGNEITWADYSDDYIKDEMQKDKQSLKSLKSPLKPEIGNGSDRISLDDDLPF